MRLLALLLAAVVLTACSSVDPVDPPNELTSFAPQIKVETSWSHKVGGGTGGKYFKLSPLLDGERLFVADRYGTIHTYHSLSGERLQRVELARAISAGPGHADGLLLFGGDNEVFAVDKQSGELRWATVVGSEVLTQPVSHGDMVIAHVQDGSIVALNSKDGAILWRHLEKVPSLTLQGGGRPLFVDNRVVFGSASGQLVALNAQDGAQLWRATIATPRGRTEIDRLVDVDADLASADGVIYAAAYQGNVAAIEAASGKLIWSREISSQSGIVVDGDHLYLSDAAGNVWALSSQNGATLWKQDVLHRRSLSAPAQQGRYLIVGDYDGYLHWLKKEDGSLAARSRVTTLTERLPVLGGGEPIPYVEQRSQLVSPVVEGTRVYGLDQRGVLNAYQLSVIRPTE